jgi:pyridoxamine 5'-phosphate oxidase
MDLASIRKEYTQRSWDIKEATAEPLQQMKIWLQEAITAQAEEPTAMALSTVDANGRPSARMVLLKGVEPAGLVFFTNYNSRKGQNIAASPWGALTFFWPALERQVRIEGKIEKIAEADAEAYFDSRPKMSRVGAWASPQSQVIPNREWLEQEVERNSQLFGGEEKVPKPPHWGGYCLMPDLVEFWQGRESRLHDRIQYRLVEGSWIIERLAP